MSLIDARDIVTQPNGWTDCNPIGHAIHHTVTMMLSPNATIEDERNQIEAIDAYHVFKEYGGFGYHTITFPSGRSYLTGNWRRARAHVMFRNHELVGSVAAGTFTDAPAPPAIIAGLTECVRTAREVFGRVLPINGHGQWADPRAPSSCPGQIRNQIGAITAAAAGTPSEEDWMSALSDDQQRELYNKTVAIWNVLHNTELGIERWAYWQILQQAGAAPDGGAVADTQVVAKAVADELARRAQD